ncbi:hypothetical protein [Mesoterricola silvestris]|uniref:Uncharacterized protein n=1 Tax=Mesoterricola silvestris TaxID=2927979 RepID=A0AA48GK20_9BACT|nr:hypothetical protein [Mesoterricola silvestris]BDU70855.1 hypothetical protein METEAL_00290 [Mesoterricola silvestris]
MSEGLHHKLLVQALLGEIRNPAEWDRHPFVYWDLEDENGVNVPPPTIQGSRPDILARDPGDRRVIIAEAKTSRDIDNRHTETQLEAYFYFLSAFEKAELWLGVPWSCGGTARRVAMNVRSTVGTNHIPMRIMDFLVGEPMYKRVWNG